MVDELPLLSARRAAPRSRARRVAAAAAPAAPASAQRRRQLAVARVRHRRGGPIVESAWSRDPLARFASRASTSPRRCWSRPSRRSSCKREPQAAPAQRAAVAAGAPVRRRARGDLRWCRRAIERYFDRSSRRTQIALDLVAQVDAAGAPVGAVRPDDTFAALAAAVAALEPSMRLAIWFVLLFAVAVVAAATPRHQRRPGELLLGQRGGSTCRSTCSCCCSSAPASCSSP